MAEAVYNNNSIDLYAEVRKMNGRKKSNPVSVNDMAGDEKISQLFSNKYEQLYNSVPCDSNVFEKIKRNINERVLNERDASYCVCVEEVVNDVKHLKSGKLSGEKGLNSDHLINAPHRLFVILCPIFHIMIVHGMCPKNMPIGTMIPIPKVKCKVVCKSDNI